MQRLKKGMRTVVLMLIFSLLITGSSTNSMVSKAAAKGKKEAAIKTISLKIGKKKVTKKTYKMKPGEKKKLKVSVSPKKGKKTIMFTTSNKKVAAVSKSGYITAKKAGSAKIKVTVKARKKGSKESVKKTTWVKIKVVKAAIQDKPTPPVTPAPDKPTPDEPKPDEPTPDEPTPTPDEPTPDEPTPTPDEPTPEPNYTKSLIVYFSCTDTTKKIAEYVQESTGADIFRIEAEVPYTAEDLNYGDSSTRATREQNDSSARPAIAGQVENMDRYQSVVIAYPIWWGQAPRIISTFLESYDFSGKTIIPICTSHSSGIGSSAANLHSLVDDSVTWLDGRRFSSTTSKEEIIKWLEDSGIKSLLEQNN